MEEEAKKVVLDVLEEHCHLKNFEQQLRIEYMRGIGSVTPKVIIVIANSIEKPRSFRTDSPKKIRDIIKALCKTLYQLENDRNNMEKKRLHDNGGCPNCGAGMEELADQGERYYCTNCGHYPFKDALENKNGLPRFNH